MSKNELTLAGWASIINGITTIPLFFIYIVLIVANNMGTKPIQILLEIISVALFVFVFSIFKKFLNKKHKFFDTDVFINIMILSSLLSVVFSMVTFIFKESEAILGIASLILLFVIGVIQVVFSIKLLKLSKEIKHMEPFAYTSLITGASYATIILFPLALIFSVVNDIILGMIFFKASEDAK